MLSICLIFSPKIRQGMLINVMLINKKTCNSKNQLENLEIGIY